MKRHDSLHPLSRDHHEGLMLCWQIQQALKQGEAEQKVVCEAFRQAWASWLPSHFEEEELWFPRLLQSTDPLRRLREEHESIRRLATELLALGPGLDPKRMGAFATSLHDHIRWEERELFPAIEREAGEKIMAEFGDAMRAIESARPRNCRIERP